MDRRDKCEGVAVGSCFVMLVCLGVLLFADIGDSKPIYIEPIHDTVKIVSVDTVYDTVFTFINPCGESNY